jgi:large subunit ribosomal protein L2
MQKKKLLSHNEKFISLTRATYKSAGRNSLGRITCYHRGGGFKRRFRLIDFQHFLTNIPGVVIRYEPDPNRRSYLILVFFSNGFFSYQICPSNLMLGSYISSGSKVSNTQIGNSLSLIHISQGSKIFSVQFSKFSKNFFSRSAGSSCLLLIKNLKANFVILRLPSAEHRIVHSECFATLGIVSNFFQKFCYFSRAGQIRNLGKRPVVRGTAMNPVDHPHGGGAGKTAGGRPSVTPWSVITKGKPTRKRKNINMWVIQSRSFYKSRKLKNAFMLEKAYSSKLCFALEFFFKIIFF